MIRIARYAAGHSGRSWGAVALVVVLVAAVAVVLAAALERPSAPRSLGPAAIVDQGAERDSSPSRSTHGRREGRVDERGERRRRSAAPRGDRDGTRERITGAGQDHRAPTTAPRSPAPPPSSGASPVRSPSAPAAGRDDDVREADDGEAEEAEEADGADEPDDADEPDGADE